MLCWRRLMIVPWTARRSNKSILKEFNPKYSLEGLMLKLKLHYFGYLMRRADSLEKTLMLGKTEGRRWGRQRMRWLDDINSMGMNMSKLWEILKDREAWGAVVHGVTKSQTQLSNWTTNPLICPTPGNLYSTFCFYECISYISSVQSLSCVRLFVTPWTAAYRASLSITNSQSLLKLTSIELVMPSSHLSLCHPLLLLPSIFPSIRVFSKESVLCIRWPKYWSFSFSISPSNEYSRLISFRIDWLDLLAVQGTLSI